MKWCGMPAALATHGDAEYVVHVVMLKHIVNQRHTKRNRHKRIFNSPNP